MDVRFVGNSGLKVSEIAIGGWLTFGASVDGHTAADILDRAVDGGVNYVDLADVYARGEAERVVGEWLKARTRHHLVLASKAFWPMSEDPNDRGLSRKHVMESVEGSLRRLGTDYLDLYYCHRYDPDTPLEETVRAMDDLVRQGKILYWGTSVWSADQLAEAHRICEASGYHRPVVEQPRYNLLDRHVEEGILDAARGLGMGVAVWSPLAGGVLTGKYDDGVPEDSRGGRSDWLDDVLTERNLERTRRLSAMAEERGVRPEHLALAWVLDHPEITCTITGATRMAQVESNLRAAEVSLDAETRRALDDLFAP
ncbi:MAG: aldo/keto reductase family protein [Myxococcota bacterium]